MDMPEIRYADSDGVSIAYQVFGDGPVDLVWVPGYVSNLQYTWQYPQTAKFAQRLGSFARVIAFDKRGTGLSDRVSSDYIPDLETRMDDVRVVMDAAGSERAVLFGISEGGPMSALFAATYPARTIALIMYGATPRFAWAPDFPDGDTDEDSQRYIEEVRSRWGSWEMAAEQIASWMAPSLAGDAGAIEWNMSFMRLGASPGAAIALSVMNDQIDVRSILPAIQAPTLVVHREGDRDVVAPSRYMNERIPGSTLVVLPGDDHGPWFGDAEALIGTIESFVRDVRNDEADLDRVLATVLFTDIVGSTAKAAEVGDRRWRELLDDHHARIRGLLARYRGREVDTAGDGFLATFDGPARAIRCATAAVGSVRDLGIEIRAGLHTGECELVDEKVRGIAVHIGARVGALAGPSEVLVSQTVKDLVAGSGLTFQDAGDHELKGVPDRWRLYRVLS